jgi:hypothetical protein
LTNYKILLVTDDRADLNLRLGEKVEVVVVPESYQTNAIFKARGLQYVIEHVFKRWNLKRTWIFHLDEESLISPQTLYGVKDIFKDSFFLVIAIMFIGVIENFPAVKGLVDYKRNGRADWQVTRKSISNPIALVPSVATASVSGMRASRT